MMQADTPPNQTIYINNLNEKVKKEGALLIPQHFLLLLLLPASFRHQPSCLT
jgi:hypothetical protein